MTLDYQDDQSGIAEITVRGTSNGQTVDESLFVTVNAFDDAPVVKNVLADLTVDEDVNNTVIDLSNLFTDIDNDDDAINLAVLNNSNPSLVTTAINGNNLTLDYLYF